MEKKIKTIASLSTHSFSVDLDEVLLRNGETGTRIKIDHPEATAILAFPSDQEILMVRQFRYALGRETLEIPAGKADPGEGLEECVRRELLEETGYDAGTIKRLYTYAPAIGYSNELIHIYSGRDLKKVGDKTDEHEIASVERVPIEKVNALIKEGLIHDGKTLIALSIMGLLTS
jgi:ADP-ribose pyrophosphatase